MGRPPGECLFQISESRPDLAVFLEVTTENPEKLLLAEELFQDEKEQQTSSVRVVGETLPPVGLERNTLSRGVFIDGM